MKGKDLKANGITINLAGKEYNLLLDFNAYCELEEVYGDIYSCTMDLYAGKAKAIRAMIYAGIKHQDETLTIKQVGSMMKISDVNVLTDQILKALELSMPKDEEIEEDQENSKN